MPSPTRSPYPDQRSPGWPATAPPRQRRREAGFVDALTPTKTVPPRRDLIVVIGGAPDTLALLRMASVRSDDIILVAETMDEAVRRFVDTFAVEMWDDDASDSDFADANAVLVALDDLGRENVAVRRARRHGIPVHVAGRPLVSDFTLLDLVERRPSSLAR